jgi:rod shape-determining protein MreC
MEKCFVEWCLKLFNWGAFLQIMLGSNSNSTKASNIALITALFLASALFVSDRGSQTIFLQTRSNIEAVATPGIKFLSIPISIFENISEAIAERSKALSENKALREELYKLRDYQKESRIMELKLSRLEQLLNSPNERDKSKVQTVARSYGEVNGPFVRSSLIDVGRKSNIQKGYAVSTVEGLYGHVHRVGKNSSRVLLLTDINSRISVMSLRSNSRAILAGNNNVFPNLIFPSNYEGWVEGDKVLTSGDGGMLPPGLEVGLVIKDAKGKLVVNLNTNSKVIDWVLVTHYSPIEIPIFQTGMQGNQTYDLSSISVGF